MKIFLSAIENNYCGIGKYFDKYKYMLCSYYYLKDDIFREVLEKSELMLIDSGAHSFQKGKKVDWVAYTKEYAEWIKKVDCNKILGYFEMDVDNIIGYEKVLELRKILEAASDKIIPVWHKNRGIDDFKAMCEKYAGKIIAITGFKNEDIRDEQYLMFLKYAKNFECKVHCLGMTRKKVIDKVPFDFVDSSSWKQHAIFGKIGNRKVTKDFSSKHRDVVFAESLKYWFNIVDYYERKWKNY